MAGSGWKKFNTGDVLTAAQVQNYLQDQSVMVFASAAARTTALTGVVSQGMVSFLTDSNTLAYYNGTTWVTVGGSPLTTKGDLYTYSTTNDRLPVGTNGQYLSADSTAATGLKWVTAGSSGMTKVTSGTFTGVTSVSLPTSTFTSTYDFYLVLFYNNIGTSGAALQARFRNAGTDYTNAGYNWTSTGFSGSSDYASGSSQTSFTLTYSHLENSPTYVWVSAVPSDKKRVSGTNFTYKTSTSTGYNQRIFGGEYDANTIDSMTFIIASGTMDGKYIVYGLAK